MQTYAAATKFYKSRPLYVKQHRMSGFLTKLRKKVGDWAGQYFAPKEEMARGYGTDYLTMGKGGFYLKTYEVIKDFKVLVIKNQEFCKGYIGQDEKAKNVKEFFKANGLGKITDQKNQIPSHDFTKISEGLKSNFNNVARPLVSTLNNMGLIFECPHDPGNNEIIIPTNMKWESIFREVQSKVLVYGWHGCSPNEFATYASVDAITTAAHKKVIDDQKAEIDKLKEDTTEITIY